jgi:hypothetical protein
LRAACRTESARPFQLTDQCPKWRQSCARQLNPGVSRIIAWLRDTWAELDYAQRRMFELNLAIPALRPPPDRADVDELEALYALPSRDPEV